MIVKNLRKSRESLGLKQKDLSNILKVSISTISGWETGLDTIPLRRLISYANTFDFSLDYLFGINDYNVNYYSMEIDLELISKNLKKIRIKNGMTQQDVAKALNTSQSAYAHYENCRNLITTTFLYGLIQIYAPFSVDKLFNRNKK